MICSDYVVMIDLAEVGDIKCSSMLDDPTVSSRVRQEAGPTLKATRRRLSSLLTSFPREFTLADPRGVSFQLRCWDDDDSCERTGGTPLRCYESDAASFRYAGKLHHHHPLFLRHPTFRRPTHTRAPVLLVP